MNSMINLRWLEGTPVAAVGVASGVPWQRGALLPGEAVTLLDSAGQALPTQTYPLAYYPDGSIKWLGVASSFAQGVPQNLRLAKGSPPEPAVRVTCRRPGIENFIRVDTGAITCDVGDRGIYFIQALSRGQRIAASGASLVAHLQHERLEGRREVRQVEACQGLIEKMTVEQSGPLRAVIKLEGRHRGEVSGRLWLPFVLRLIFYAGLDTIQLVHTILYDGNPMDDFIAGLGVRCRVPLEDGLHNRHMRFMGESGVWCEPVRYHYVDGNPESRRQQLDAQAITPPENGGMLPAWSDFQLWQDSPDHCLVRKRLGEYGCWVDAVHGGRAAGLGGLSDPRGGLAVGINDFWQSYPTLLEARDASGADPQLTAWLWSPESPPMDLRHYGNRDYRNIYEAVNPDPNEYSTPYGIARTSELTLWAIPPGATHADFARQASLLTTPPRLVCAPEHYHACRVFGYWGLPDRSTPARALVEDELDEQFEYLRSQIDQRRWYGFWNYGDVMHTYDTERHTWRYDIGGYAWNNEELGSCLWWWYHFLRTGKASAFRAAAAQTRHNSEVDTYHFGRWAGLGTRHNVVHWGCPCKEPRVSVAAPRRIFYYLTADERMGDLLDELVTADQVDTTNVPNEPRPMARIGSVWTSYVASWLTAWERRNDTRWRDRILAGFPGILAAPYRLLTGNPFDYNRQTGEMTYSPDFPMDNRLVMIFGGAEILMELMDLLDHPRFHAALVEYGRVYGIPKPDFDRWVEPELQQKISLRFACAKLTAWAGRQSGDTGLLHRAWQMLLEGDGFNIPRDQPERPLIYQPVQPPLSAASLVESPNFGTNHQAQWCLNAIACLELAREALDAAVEKGQA